MALGTKKRSISNPVTAPVDDLDALEAESAAIQADYARLLRIGEELTDKIRSGDDHPDRRTDSARRIDGLAQAMEAGQDDIVIPPVSLSLAERCAANIKAIEHNRSKYRALLPALQHARFEVHFSERHFQARKELAQALLLAAEKYKRVQDIAAEAVTQGAAERPSFLPFANFSSASQMPAALREMRPKDFERDNKNLLT